VIAGLRCNYPKDGPGFFAGSRSDGFCRLRRNQAPLSLYAIVLKLHDTCDQEVWHVEQSGPAWRDRMAAWLRVPSPVVLEFGDAISGI
jgi:hypothetical protein